MVKFVWLMVKIFGLLYWHILSLVFSNEIDFQYYRDGANEHQIKCEEELTVQSD